MLEMPNFESYRHPHGNVFDSHARNGNAFNSHTDNVRYGRAIGHSGNAFGSILDAYIASEMSN
jgi:hypothetical protein